mmetsp:Transcript_112701/g.195218  ORF Transcript_112701/g.195218 Transcript_112701/m.195218 type:complete len:103 (-) Transcript_112701:52-360(-)
MLKPSIIVTSAPGRGTQASGAISSYKRTRTRCVTSSVQSGGQTSSCACRTGVTTMCVFGKVILETWGVGHFLLYSDHMRRWERLFWFDSAVEIVDANDDDWA